MALAPARLLLPVRAVESPHSSALSSASVCSAVGAYPHLSSFFFHPPSHRNSFSVSASIVEAQNKRAYKQSRHNQLRQYPDEAVSFDDLQNPYAEDPFRHPSRDLNGRARSAPRLGRVDGNGGRRAWETSNYPPWKQHGIPERARYNKSLSSQGNRNASSWTSNVEHEASDARRGWSMGYRKSRNIGLEARDMENNGYARRYNAYSGNTPWKRQGESFQRHASRFDTLRQEKPPDAFYPQENGGYQKKRGNFNNSWGSSMDSREEFEHQSDRYGRHSRSRSYPPNSVVNLQPHAQSSHSMQRNIDEGRMQEKEEEQGELVERFKEANLEFLGKPEQENSSPSGSSPISRIMQRLRSVEDRIPELRAREGLHSRSELADVLALPSAREYLSDRSLPKSSSEQSENGVEDTRFPWERTDVVNEEDSAVGRGRKLRSPSSADRWIPGPELRRLRILAVHLKQRVKIGKHGVTQDLVNSIQKRFCTCEVVKVKCEGPPAGNMKKTLETLEEKTGGSIIWKAGSAAVLYRGQNYGQPISEIVDDLLAKKYESLVSSDGRQEASSRASQKDAANEVGFIKEGHTDSFDAMEDATEQFNSGASLLAKKYESLVSSDGRQEASSRASQKHAANEVGFVSEGHMDSFDAMEHATEQFNSGAGLDDADEHSVSDAGPGNASKWAASKRRTKTSGPEFDTLEEYTIEVENILKDLGPLYEEWTGPKPVPVDADLLPSSIPNYSPPYRLLPFGMRPTISNTTATHLRRLSRPLAPHFVIGRDRGLQGLAAAMVKLWEKSEIAKIGVKRGILNTSQERIAEDLKQLSGGFFLCRDKYSMTFYRGKDFLPQTISAALTNRQHRAEDLQVQEERGRTDGSVNVIRSAGRSRSLPTWVHIIDPEEQMRLKREAAKARRVQVIAYLERKLKMALQKKQKAGRELDKVEQLLKPVSPSDDKEILTDEERFMLRKLGLKMKAFLLIGRRGVFSGVVQNMHLHWKHRELVKIVVKERDPVRLNETARMLEAESGGTLISVDPTSKGFAIVVYRGKNYTRPPELRPPNLLTKRLALRRSLEMQRRESLSRHMQGLEEEIAHLRSGLNKMKLLESRDESVLSKDCNNAHDILKLDNLHERQQNQVEVISPTGSQGMAEDFVHESSTKQGLVEDDEILSIPKPSRWKLKSMCEIGPIFKAVRLSRTERHALRDEVVKMGRAPHFLVGRSNPMSAIAKAIRLHFLDHAFVKIGVSYRPRGTSVQDVVEELEDLTGGTAYAQDDFRVVLYRGWPSGEDLPLGALYDVLSPEQCDILEDKEDEEGDDEEEAMMESTLTEAAEKPREDEESDKDDDMEDESMSLWDSFSDDDEDDVVNDEEGDDELRSELTLVKSFKSSDDEEVDEALLWDKFSDVHAGDGNDDDNDNSLWTMSLDGRAGNANDSRKSLHGNAVNDDDHKDKGGDWGHEHVQDSSVENNHRSADSSFKEDIEVECGTSMAGTSICVGSGAMAVDFGANEHAKSYSIEENGSSAGSRSIKLGCGSFLAGASDDAGGDEMGLDLDLDEDV